MTASIIEAARAKINLALHVTGKRADGYHLLESVVTFADCADRIEISPSQQDSFEIDGRFAPLLSNEGDNLVTRSRDRLRLLAQTRGQRAEPVAIRLTKTLPIASGIGGGSADAAATIRGLMRAWKLELSPEDISGLAVGLGADVPMCLHGRPLIARGIGEDLHPLTSLPAFPILLVNPLVGVSTPEIFRRLERRDNPPLPPLADKAAEWLACLAALRNDLQPPAAQLVEEIPMALAMLEETDAELIRMSGSGATCFGLYGSEQAAHDAASHVRQRHPGWFIHAGMTIEGQAE